jgi:iron complex outermembrane receptor protein
MLYANFQTGYNQGGFSSTPAAAGSSQAAPFSPMTVKALTGGIKNRFWDNRITFNVEGFYYRYRNYQVSARNLITGQNQIFNAEKATTYGVQFDARAQLTPDNQVGASVALLHAKEDILVLPVAPFSNYSGYWLPYSPAATLNADYTHTFRLGNGAELAATGSYRWIANEWAIYTHANGTFIRHHDFIDASLTYTAPNGRWSFAVWGRNLGDTFTYGLLNGGNIPGPGAGIPQPPRTYGVRLTAHM